MLFGDAQHDVSWLRSLGVQGGSGIRSSGLVRDSYLRFRMYPGLGFGEGV